MPKRPPRKWMKDCVKGVQQSEDVKDPNSVCGSLWYHKMSPADRRAAIRRHESMKKK